MEALRPLPPIPVPPSQRWREIRLLYLPRLVFILGVIGAAMLWSRWVTPATLVAEAEGKSAEIRSAQAGFLIGLNVVQYQAVSANEVLGHVAVYDPKFLDATLAVIRAEVGMLSDTLAGATDRMRVMLEFERLQLDWMGARVELANLKGKLNIAEGDVLRFAPLHKTGVVSEDQFALVKDTRDALLDQVKAQTDLVNRLEPVITSMGAGDGKTAAQSMNAALAAAIKVEEAKIKQAEQQLMPVALVSPIAGIVSVVFRRTGEAVVSGEPILRVMATQPERLNGYLRQPLIFEPKVGMEVELRSRSYPRQVATSRITGVGPGMEPLSLTLATAMRIPSTTGQAQVAETGLKVTIAIPAGFNVRPGEIVDVVTP